jgi:hypothetical protein
MLLAPGGAADQEEDVTVRQQTGVRSQKSGVNAGSQKPGGWKRSHTSEENILFSSYS